MNNERFRIEKRETQNITLRLDKLVIDEFDKLSVESNISKNALIEKALKYALNNLEFVNDKNN